MSGGDFLGENCHVAVAAGPIRFADYAIGPVGQIYLPTHPANTNILKSTSLFVAINKHFPSLPRYPKNAKLY